MLEGETNFITVDRENILQTTFEEIKEIEDPAITFEVDFYSERAQDSTGSRREWLRLCNRKVSLIFSNPKFCAVPPTLCALILSFVFIIIYSRKDLMSDKNLSKTNFFFG